MNRKITKLDLGRTSFTRSLKGLPQDVLDCLQEALIDLLKDPQPKRLRLEKLESIKNPGVYTIHVTPNHSHKASFEIEGTTAILRRVGTHKLIDRTP